MDTQTMTGAGEGSSDVRGKRPLKGKESEKRKKQRAEKGEKEQREWENAVAQWEFICERQIDLDQLESQPFVQIIRDQDLASFFKPVKGYKPKTVKTFYAKMTIKFNPMQFISKVGGKTVTITPQAIADYLRFGRPEPEDVTYPSRTGEPWTKPLSVILDLVADGDIGAWDGRAERFVLGRMNNTFRALNKVLHYNLSPFTNEKKPTKTDVNELYMFGSPATEVCDWGLFVWGVMKRFRRGGLAKKNIPFPAMVTYFCDQAGVRLAGDSLVPGNPGPFNSSSYKKSCALSTPQRPETASTSRPRARSGNARIEEWLEILVAGQAAAKARDEKRERQIAKVGRVMARIGRRMDRAHGRLERRVEWLLEEHAQATGHRYVPTEPDLELDTESEPDDEEVEQEIAPGVDDDDDDDEEED